MTKALYEMYGTVQILVNGQRLILGMVTFRTGDDHAGVVRALLDACARQDTCRHRHGRPRVLFPGGNRGAERLGGHVDNTVSQHGIRQWALTDFEAGRCNRVSDAVITSSPSSSDRQESPYTITADQK